MGGPGNHNRQGTVSLHWWKAHKKIRKRNNAHGRITYTGSGIHDLKELILVIYFHILYLRIVSVFHSPYKALPLLFPPIGIENSSQATGILQRSDIRNLWKAGISWRRRKLYNEKSQGMWFFSRFTGIVKIISWFS